MVTCSIVVGLGKSDKFTTSIIEEDIPYAHIRQLRDEPYHAGALSYSLRNYFSYLEL
jgi:hypothetical protein